MEAKYNMAATTVTQEVGKLVCFNSCVDTKSAIHWLIELQISTRSQRIYSWWRQHRDIKFVATQDQLADAMTKHYYLLNIIVFPADFMFIYYVQSS